MDNVLNSDLTQFEKLARKVESLPEKDQRDICLIIQGYLACNAAMVAEKVS